MALEGKCSTEQVNGQTSTPIENTTCTVMRRQTLRTLFLFQNTILTYARTPWLILATVIKPTSYESTSYFVWRVAEQAQRQKKSHVQVQWCHTNSWEASITLSTTNTTAPHSPLQPAAVTEQGWAHPGELSAHEGCWAQPSTPRCHPWLFRAPALLYLSFTSKHSVQSTYLDIADSV